MGRIIEHTLSICNTCGEVIEADLLREGNDIYMVKSCEKHGIQKALYWKDADLFEKAAKIIPTHEICEYPRCLDSYDCKKHARKTTDLMINFTDRCNYHCPVCFSDSALATPHEPSIGEILERLPHTKGFNRPTACIIGGEPTVRDDLTALISGLVEKGFYPKLTTNGFKLNDLEYLRKLRQSGLEWIILQFDGFSDDTHRKLRGRPLQEMKEELIPKLESFGFKIHLAVMTIRGVNLDEVGKIVEFALQHRNIIWVSFYPQSNINRVGLRGGDTFIAEVMDALETQSAGRIRKEDFLRMMKVFSLLYRITGMNRLKPKMSIFSLLVVSDGNEYFPVVRLLNPFFALKKTAVVVSLLRNLPNILNYQKKQFPSNLIALNIEKFHDRDTIDLREASNCHMAYITRNGYVPFDIYNNIFRKTRNW